ncbi:MAG TPA: 2-succinyl-5-enolpyruvyl-6-hydroxy-3-cyclohexene-1-carboxylic-acid synthase [Trebonia sp.]|nr:2-succinyl-5-enolpyruvyl-6-hydroxy-3-cyclohexene-1-carboxylic-acid synthase [Trebonia sp.]
MNPSTAFATVFADELARCGVREVVIAPGSRSTPLAMAFHALDEAGRLRLHVRIDERAAGFTALGLAKASRRPVAVLCTSGTAVANFHPAVIEAGESGVPLLVLTADRPPELRGAGASQTIDQVKLYGDAVRWYADPGVPERRAGAVAAWRSLACQAWARASGATGTFPGPVHVNLPLRDPLVPDAPGTGEDWPEPLDGRPGGAPWTRFPALPPAAQPPGGQPPPGPSSRPLEPREPLRSRPAPRPGYAPGLPGGWPDWARDERGVVVCGDGDYDVLPVLALARRAGWPVLAEPSSGARQGPNALTAYQYLLGSPEFMAAHRPDVIVSAGRPGLSRPQSALLRTPGVRLVVVAQGPGHWADQARMATDVVSPAELAAVAGRAAPEAAPSAPRSSAPLASPGARAPAGPAAPASGWLAGWLRADEAARAAADAILDEEEPGAPAEPGLAGALSEQRLARDLVRALPEGALLWVGSSMPVRDVDFTMPPRDDVRVLASRGASGIDGTASSAIGAALAHQAPPAPGGAAFALVGDLTFVHDVAGLAIGPDEPRPDLCLIVVNNDGGGIFSTLEQAGFPGSFERLFGTRHGADVQRLAGSFDLPYLRVHGPEDFAKALADAGPGRGLRIIEARTDRAASTALRARVKAAAIRAVAGPSHPAGDAGTE